MTDASCSITGRLGKDAELRSTASGVQLISLLLATDHKSRDGGRETDWWDVVCWRPSEWLHKLKKGDPVEVKGAMQWREWEDKDGNKRRNLEIHAVRVLGLSIGGNAGADQQDSAAGSNVSGGEDNDLPF